MQLNYLAEAVEQLSVSWLEVLAPLSNAQVLQNIDNKLGELHQSEEILPPAPLAFNALRQTSFEQIKVVIIGQDPYHGVNQANGLAFAVNRGVALPPSLKNIFLELEKEYNVDMQSKNGELLLQWAQQGVLLLNSGLSVIRDRPNSLVDIGWHQVTDYIITQVGKRHNNIVFMLWGAFAQRKAKLLDEKQHLLLKAPHPSPLSAYRGFLGCNHFKLANQYLLQHGHGCIQWT